MTNPFPDMSAPHAEPSIASADHVGKCWWYATGVAAWMRGVICLGLMLGTALGVQGQQLVATWFQQSPANSPAARGNGVMAYDSGHQRTVLFGGGSTSDTWLWDGSNWTQASPANSPSPRGAASMAFDAAHGQMVLFGGIQPNSGTARLGDTWLWDGTNWTQAGATGGPSARDGQAMAYDPVHGYVVMFGGIDVSGTVLNDTWLWNGSTWTQANPAHIPSARFSHSVAYDAATGQVLLFGGETNGQYTNDTWVWSGTDWILQSPANAPPARYDAGLAYDAALGQMVLFGGYSGSYLNDTWYWSGTAWTQTTPIIPPSGRYLNNQMVYDAARGEILLFGGYSPSGALLGDTWEYDAPGNFGNVNVCPQGQGTPVPCNETIDFIYYFPNGTTLGTPIILTQGTAAADFAMTNSGTGSCSGTVLPGYCTASIQFTPQAQGVRAGEIELTDTGGNVVSSSPIYGVGQAPAVAFAPSAQSTVNPGSFTLSTPKGVLADTAGNVFISDTGEQSGLPQVIKVTPSGATSSVGSGLLFPQGMAEDGAGNLYIADNNRNQIVEVPAGCTSATCQIVIGSSFASQLGVAVDGAGNVFFGDFLAGEVIESPAGCTSAACERVVYSGVAGSEPVGITVDSTGNLFVADFGLKQVVEVPAGCTSANCQRIVGSGWSEPDGVAVDAAGNVFVADHGLSEVVEVPAGCAAASCQTVVASGVGTVAVTLNPAGDLYLDDIVNRRVIKYSRSQPPSLSFASTNVGDTSSDSPQSVTLQNIGNQPLNAVNPGLLLVGGPNFVNVPGPGTPADCSGAASLIPGQSCNVSLNFRPQSGGTIESVAVFHDNALNATTATQSISLSGVGVNPSYSIAGTLSGLSGGTVVLQLNLGNNLTFSGNTPFVFSTTLATGSPYSVTVLTQPAGQVCTVTNGSGTVANANITNVQVTCASLVNYPLTVISPGTGTGSVTDSLGQIACVGANGGVTGTCAVTYPSGTPVTLTASTSGNSVFVGWGGACSSFGAAPSCIVAMNSALNVSGSFVAPPAAQAAMLKPITAGVVYGQGGSFTSGAANTGGVTANSLSLSQGMVFDGSGNLYVSDGNNNRVLFYSAGSTTATRVYGQNGSFASNASNNGGMSANSLSNPQGLALDSSGNLYVADQYNSRVLFYPVGSTTATRVYGQNGNFTTGGTTNGVVSASSLFVPGGIALDSGGNLYVADYGNNRVLFYPAGSTTATRVYGQGGSFTSNTVNNGGISANSLNQPWAIALDSSGDLYVADSYNNRVLFYPANSNTATQVYGQGGSFTTGTINNGGVNASSLYSPFGLTVDSNGGLYVVDRSNNRVLYYPFGSTAANRAYGQSGSFTGSAQNSGGVSANSLNQPWAVALDPSGNLYVADYGNNRVLEYGSFGNVNACPANQGTPAPCNNTVTYSYAPAANSALGATQVVTQGVTGLDFTLGSGNTCTGTILEGGTCNVNVNFAPLAPGLRSGAVELFDNAGNALATTPIYGVGQGPVIAYGPGTQGTLAANLSTRAAGVAVDAAGNVFVAGGLGAIKLTPSGVQTTFPLTGLGASGLYDVAVDGAGNVYFADSNNNRIIEIAPNGVQTIVPATGLNFPSGVTVDGSGNLFITDRDNNRVVKITLSGVQTTVPTTGLVGPYYPAVDAAGDVFFLDSGSQRVLKVTPGGVQSTVPFSGLNAPNGVAVDAAGDVFVSDQVLGGIFELTPGGVQTTVTTGGLSVPAGLAVDAAGNLFIAVNGENRVAVVIRSQVPSLSFATTDVGRTSLDSPQTIVLQNVGNQALVGTPALNLGGNFTESSSANCQGTLTLAPGAICVQTLSFTPQSATFLSGTDVFTDNNFNGSPSLQTISVSGIGSINGVAGTVAVPNVIGQVQTAATTPITVVGLVMGTVTTASSDTVPSGSIISQSPDPATQVAVGSAVNLLVSSGIAQPPSANPLTMENNYFVTGDYVSAGVTLHGHGINGMANGTVSIPSYSSDAINGVPDGADVIDAFLYWQTLENTPFASSTSGTFNGYPITGQQIGNDIPSYFDGQFTGTIRTYRAAVNAYLPVGANGIRIVSGTYTVSLPDGKAALPITEGASLVMVYRVLSPNFPLKSVVIYDGAAAPAVPGTQVVKGFYDAAGGANGTGKNTNLYSTGGNWNNSAQISVLASTSQFSAPLNTASAYAAVIFSTRVNNSDNDGILDAWKTGPGAGDFHSGQPGYYDAKTGTWVGLPGAKHGQKDLFVQLDYMCGGVLSDGSCDTTKENLFPSPDASGNDPLAMVQQAFANSGVQLHLQIGNAVPEDTCVDSAATSSTPAVLCQFPGAQGVVGWKNSLEFSKLYPRNLLSCITGGDCTTRFPYGQKDSYHYVLMGHSLAIPAWNTRYGTLTSINVVNGVTTIGTVDRGAGINACPSRITLGGVIGNPSLNGVYNTTGCADTKTITLLTPGVPNWSYPNSTLPEPVIGLTSGTISSISGYSDLGGADSAVTLGLWLTAPNQDMSKKANVLAGTIFHEIGHTLGLSHGGLYYDTPNSYVPTFEGNCKPNYQSVMNYLFQLDLVGPNATLAFSNQTLSTLNEATAGSVTQLIDSSGNAATFPTSAWYVPYTTGSSATPATRHCDGTPLNGDAAYRVDSSIAPITPAWTNGQDINFIGALQTQERGFNDLANMDLRQIGATGGEFASLATLLSFGSSVSPLNIGANGNVTLGSGGTVALGSGGTVTLGSGGNVTLGSGGTVTLGSGGTVTLGSGGNVTLGSGGTVTAGSSGSVALALGGTVTLGSGGTITLGSGGNVTLGSGGNVTLSSGGTIAVDGGVTVTIPSTGGSYTLGGSGGTVTLGSGGNVTLGSGGTVTLGSGGIIALGSGGTVTLGSGGNVTLGSGGTVALGSGGNVTLGSGGNVTLGSGGTIALGSGGTVTLGSGGNVTLGSGGTVTLGSGGNVALGSGGNVTLGSGGSATLGAGGTVTLGSGGNVTLGSGGNVTLGSGGTVALGSGGNVTLGSGGTVTLSSGGTVALGSGGTVTLGSGGTVTLGSGGTVTLGSGGAPISISAGGTVTLGSGGTVTLGSGGNVTLGSGGNVTLGSGGIITQSGGGTVTLGSGGNVTLGSGGTVTLGSGGNVTLGSGGTVTLGSGGNVTLGSGGVVTLGNGGGNVSLGSGSNTSLGTVNNITPASGGPISANELTYETANSVVRPPSSPTETATPTGGVRITWQAPAFGVVQTYTIYRSSNGATPIVIGSVSGVNGNPPATEFTDTNPDLISKTVVYTISTTLVPDATGGTSRQSQPSVPAVLKNDQSITLGPLPSSVTITSPPTVTATAMSGGVPNGLQVNFSATGSCAIGSQSVLNNVSSATLTLSSTGSCTVTASQLGTTSFNAANSVSGTFMVLPQGSGTQSQTITFSPIPNVQYGGAFSLNATSSASPSIPVSFMAFGPCATNGTISGAGVCTITASAAASGNYSAASLTQSFNIYPAVLTVTANSVPSVYGQPLPTLTYNYTGFVKGDTASVVNGAPALSTTATSASNAGTYPITVSTGTLATPNYSFLYVSGTLTIQQANQSPLTVTATSPLTYNQSETLGVVGGTTGGAVTYLNSGPCTLTSAKLTASSGTGFCQITATMAGNANFNAVTSPTRSVTLGLAAQTITFNTSAPVNAVYNSSFTVAASAAGGAVTFTSSGACINSGATYKMTSGTGICSVIANQIGNSNYAPAPQLTKTVAATLATPTATFTGAPASAAYHTTFTVATTTNASATPVVTSSGSCSNAGDAVAITSGAGTCSLTATWAADSNYIGTKAMQSTTAVKATPTVTFTGAPSSAAYRSVFTVTTTTNASASAAITSSGACSNLGATVTMTSGTGTCSLKATWPADNNYNGATATQSVTAIALPQTINFITGPPASALYNSSFTVVAKGGASAVPLTFTSAGACTNTGATYKMTNSTGTCSVIANQAGNANYAPAAQVTKTVTATGPFISVSPSSIDFGTVYAGSIQTRNVTLTNTGTAPATINDPILSIVKGGNSNEFISLSLCPRPLAAGKSCTVTIAFFAGPFYTPQTATLQIMSNAPGSPQPVALSATVISPQVSFSPSSLSFGAVKHGTSSTLNVTISNPGGTPLIFSGSGISITGVNAASFVQSNACGTSIAARATCSIAVKFTPSAPGKFSGALTLVDNSRTGNGTQTVQLSGTGD